MKFAILFISYLFIISIMSAKDTSKIEENQNLFIYLFKISIHPSKRKGKSAKRLKNTKKTILKVRKLNLKNSICYNKRI